MTAEVDSFNEKFLNKKFNECPQLFSSKQMKEILARNWKLVLDNLPQVKSKLEKKTSCIELINKNNKLNQFLF
jgi:hypothetical protein